MSGDDSRAARALRREPQEVPTAESIERYGQNKNAIIQEILAAAGLSEEERRIIDSAQIPTRDEVPR